MQTTNSRTTFYEARLDSTAWLSVIVVPSLELYTVTTSLLTTLKLSRRHWLVGCCSPVLHHFPVRFTDKAAGISWSQNAGTDVNCGNFYQQNTGPALQDGSVTMVGGNRRNGCRIHLFVSHAVNAL